LKIPPGCNRPRIIGPALNSHGSCFLLATPSTRLRTTDLHAIEIRTAAASRPEEPKIDGHSMTVRKIERYKGWSRSDIIRIAKQAKSVNLRNCAVTYSMSQIHTGDSPVNDWARSAIQTGTPTGGSQLRLY
jgi:hypothetical protein